MLKDEVTYAFWFLLVAIIWGATNPFLKKGGSGIENVKKQNFMLQFIAELKFLVFNWQYAVPFILNQFGSVVYYFTIAKADISLAVPITNSLTFITSTVVGRLLGEPAHSRWTYLGLTFVVCGVALCVSSKMA